MTFCNIQRGKCLIVAIILSTWLVYIWHNKSAQEYTERSYIDYDRVKNGENPYTRYKFNQAVSDDTPVDRKVPDTRDRSCLSKKYGPHLQATSLIITFHNEARSVLLRTIKSVLNRTPPRLLQEIILVDDFSDNVDDGRLLLHLPKVKLLRNKKREGLIRSRIYGAKASNASVLTFLDSHCEVNIDWLLPLLHVVSKNPSAVASPLIDVIDYHDFQYKRGAYGFKGGFDWNLQFRWKPIANLYADQQVTPSDPIKTPMIAGGLFTIRKNWFFHLGTYDPNLEIWGGENFELSFKTWMCGGEMVILPCSRVGHVFRKEHPYSFPGGNSWTYLKNIQRVAEVWMDLYKKYIYKITGGTKVVSDESLSSRRKLRQRLKCKSFKWYLKNVYPDLTVPADDTAAYGHIKQVKAPVLCISNPSHYQLSTAPCTFENKDQWVMTTTGAVRSSSGYCLTIDDDDVRVKLATCQKDDNRQMGADDSKSYTSPPINVVLGITRSLVRLRDVQGELPPAIMEVHHEVHLLKSACVNLPFDWLKLTSSRKNS